MTGQSVVIYWTNWEKPLGKQYCLLRAAYCQWVLERDCCMNCNAGSPEINRLLPDWEHWTCTENINKQRVRRYEKFSAVVAWKKGHRVSKIKIKVHLWWMNVSCHEANILVILTLCWSWSSTKKPRKSDSMLSKIRQITDKEKWRHHLLSLYHRPEVFASFQPLPNTLCFFQ